LLLHNEATKFHCSGSLLLGATKPLPAIYVLLLPRGQPRGVGVEGYCRACALDNFFLSFFFLLENFNMLINAFDLDEIERFYFLMMLFSIAVRAIENSIRIRRVCELTNASYPLLRFAPIDTERSVTTHYASLLSNWSEA